MNDPERGLAILTIGHRPSPHRPSPGRRAVQAEARARARRKARTRIRPIPARADHRASEAGSGVLGAPGAALGAAGVYENRARSASGGWRVRVGVVIEL